jgi:gamma-glutamyltranspeptidase/glutathione hydrolase
MSEIRSTSDNVVASEIHPQRLAASRHGMVATAHYRATEAAVEILRDGGNAADAAVAAAFALGVCEPVSSGLGGQTMAIVHTVEPRRTVALDGSSRAPNRATPGLLKKSERRSGHTASTVPSTPATLEYLRDRFGTMPLARVAEPAIRLAREGFRITDLMHRLVNREIDSLRRGTAAQLFLEPDGHAPPIGTLLKQPALAETLDRLATAGVEDFYTGGIAQQIHADMEAHDGLIHLDDLAQIPWPRERRPLSCRFDGLRVLTFPPPGAGRTLVEMLNILSHVPPKNHDLDTVEGALHMAEVIRRAFLDRRDRPFDPDFYPQVEDRRMLSEDYAKLVANQIRRRIKTNGETTHLSVMDRFGNVVTLTQSIERVLGSCEANPKLGFLYNNYMSAFEYSDISHPYYLRPNAVPWASVAPTIVFRGRRPWLALGSTGSDRITPGIVQVLLRLLHGNQPLDAVAAPRLFCSLKGKVSLEASRMRNDLPRAFERLGFTADTRQPFSFYLGCVQLVVRNRGEFLGVADPRRDGSAVGPER